MTIEHLKHFYFYMLLLVVVCVGKCVNGCFHVHGDMSMCNSKCTMCEPVFGGLKFTCVFFDDSLLIEAGSLTLTEPRARARAYQFNYSNEPASPSLEFRD